MNASAIKKGKSLFVTALCFCLAAIGSLALGVKAQSYTISKEYLGAVPKNFAVYTIQNDDRNDLKEDTDSSSLPISKFSDGSTVLFCLEPEISYVDGLAYSSRLTGSSALDVLMKKEPSLSYSSAQIEKMKQICSVGYGYLSNTDDNMYMATQIALWQVSKPEGFNSISPSVKKNLNQISKRLSVFETPVSFKDSTLAFKGYGQSNALSINDENAMLSNYSLLSAPDGVHVSIEGNVLHLWIDENAPKSGTISFYALYEPDTATNDNIVYYSANSQIIGDFGIVSPPQFDLSYDLETDLQTGQVSEQISKEAQLNVDLQVIKTDGNTSAPIQGAVFDFYRDDKKIGTQTTDENGKADFAAVLSQNLVSKTYEESYVKNWQDLSSKAQQEALAAGYYENQEAAQNAAKQKAQEDWQRLEEEFLSGSHTYKVVEISTKQGYYLDPDQTTQIKDLSGAGTIDFDFVNEAITGSITVEKSGQMLAGYSQTKKESGLVYTKFSYENQRLAGIEFTLKADEDLYDAGGKKVYDKNALVATLITDENGEASMNDLPLGKYVLKESKTKDGLILDSQSYEIDLSTDSSSQKVVSYLQAVENQRQKMALDFTKTNAQNQALANAKYALYTTKDIVYGNKSIPAGTLIEESLSNENGKLDFISDLPVGSYKLVEISAPAGYERNEAAHAIEPVLSNNQSTYTFKGTLIDTFAPVNITLTKTDAQTKKAIKDASVRFGLYEESDLLHTQKIAYISAQTGSLSFEIEQPGTYYIQELSAPKGYDLASKKIKVQILQDGSVLVDDTQSSLPVSIAFTNNPSNPVSPNTGVMLSYGVYALVLVIALALIIFLVWQRKKNA
jgi:hypothetical protein